MEGISTRKALALLCVVAFGAAAGCAGPPFRAAPQGLSVDALDEILREEGSGFSGRPGRVQFLYDGVRMGCVVDVDHDRMRIIAPIVEESRVTDEQLRIAMEANFHTALDARYALSSGVLYAAFIHPLSSLREEQVRSAVRQVASLVKTFGSTYTSGMLLYGLGDPH